MRFNKPDHVYRCKPYILDNQSSDEPFFISVRGVTAEETDKNIIAEMMMTPDKRAENSIAFIDSKIVKIEGVEVDGVELTTAKQLRESAPREIYQWVCAAVMSTEVMTRTEVKN